MALCSVRARMRRVRHRKLAVVVRNFLLRGLTGLLFQLARDPDRLHPVLLLLIDLAQEPERLGAMRRVLELEEHLLGAVEQPGLEVVLPELDHRVQPLFPAQVRALEKVAVHADRPLGLPAPAKQAPQRKMQLDGLRIDLDHLDERLDRLVGLLVEQEVQALEVGARQLPRSYFKGLNFLLNEQPDKAIEAFIEVVKVDPETVELHFALGSLFRRRGETERAIRMHRNLLERPDLGGEQRLHAMVELGQDYLKAGLLDRAEEMFLKLNSSPHRSEALRFLLEIYQQEKDWMKAVGIALELEKDSGQSAQKEIANYYCELALSEVTHSRPEGAKRHLEAALAAHRKCVRANIILGDVAAASGDHDGAIQAWKRIEQQNPAYLALVAQRLLESHRALGCTEEGLTLLRGYLANFPSLDLLDVAFQSTLDSEGPETAYKLVKDELRRNQTLLGLDKLLEAQLLVAPAERRHDLELVRNLIHSHTQRLARYHCENCGFKARQFYWHCPACGGWETYPPRRNEEFELTP